MLTHERGTKLRFTLSILLGPDNRSLEPSEYVVVSLPRNVLLMFHDG